MNIKTIVFVLLCVITILFSSLFAILAHEQVHILNNERVGVESVIEFGRTGRIGEPVRDISNFEMIHLQNEIVNYNIMPWLLCIIAILFFGFLYLGEILKEGVEK